MRRLFVVIVCTVFVSANAGSIPGADMPFPLGMIRGVFTIIQSPLEIPRAVVFCTSSVTNDNYRWISGPLGGIFAMPFLVTGRAVIGTADFCTLGLAGNKLYDKSMAPMIWHSKWISEDSSSSPEDAAQQNNLGYNYQFGKGVKKDLTKAIYWYRKAANQGYAMAQYNLGVCYANGRGVAQDYTEAVKWYRKAAEQGYADAQNNLGRLYENGRGVAQDYTEAVKWYRKAAEQGAAIAQNNLGACYYNGQGAKKDYKLAAFWFMRSAKQGNALGQNNLGECYRDGDGVEKDLAKARFWFEKSAKQGNKRAQENLRKINK